MPDTNIIINVSTIHTISNSFPPSARKAVRFLKNHTGKRKTLPLAGGECDGRHAEKEKKRLEIQLQQAKKMEVINLAGSFDDPIDLALLDIILPDMKAATLQIVFKIEANMACR